MESVSGQFFKRSLVLKYFNIVLTFEVLALVFEI